MKRSFLAALLFVPLVLVSGSPQAAAEEPNVEIDVSVKSLGSESKVRSRTSKRILVVRIENDDDVAYNGLELEWRVAGRDINTRKTRIVATGAESVNLPADEEIEVETGSFSFTTTEGKVERVKKKGSGNNKKSRQKVHPDTGMRYSGYAVILKKDGKVIAEAGTPGMR